MSVAAKICGLSTPESVDAAVRGGARWVGFIFFPASPRNVSVEQVAALADRVPYHVGRVGVFVNPNDALLEHAVAAGLDAIQLHGDEDPARAAAIRARLGVEVWKVIPVRTGADLAAAQGFVGAADRLLFESKPPKGSDLPGGLGLRFDWRLMQGWKSPLPWLLSGGLDAANVGEAAAITGAEAVDVSSGVEDAPGAKSLARIDKFLKIVDGL
jgi:phosphoribosylanthranilate isomerase